MDESAKHKGGRTRRVYSSYGGRPCHYEKIFHYQQQRAMLMKVSRLRFYILWPVSHKTRFFERLRGLLLRPLFRSGLST